MDMISIRRKTEREKKAISPVIATLLLILIAIAAGVVVYAYVIGFIGNSTTNPGATTSVIQITDFCIGHTSGSTACNGGNLYIAIQNTGSVAVALSGSSEAQMYFTDVASGASAQAACTSATSSVSPGSSYTCSAAYPSLGTINVGDTITLKVVNPDGGSATSSVKAIA